MAGRKSKLGHGYNTENESAQQCLNSKQESIS